MNDMEKVFSIIDASRDEMIATLSRWIKIPSVQGDSYDADITIRKNSAGGIIYGLYDVVETHSVKLTMEDLTGNGINVYGYYTGSANINGQADISISRCQGSNIKSEAKRS